MRRTLLAIWACCWLVTAAPTARASSELLTIDVRDADISDVIAMLAAQSGVNVVTDGSVKPERVTLRLHGVTFDEALRVIASAHSLQVRSEGGILVVGAAESMNPARCRRRFFAAPRAGRRRRQGAGRRASARNGHRCGQA